MKDRITATRIGGIFYIIAAVFTLTLFFVTMSLERDKNDSREFSDWYSDAALTEPVNTKHPQLEDNGCVFYADVPDDVKTGDCIWFKSKNALISVSVGGEERVSLDWGEYAVLYGKTVGTDWICVPLDISDSGKLIVIDFTSCYGDSSAYIDDALYGKTTDVMRETIGERIFGSMMCLLLAFTGLILIFVYIILRPHISGMPKGLVYIGTCSIFTAIWSFSELRVIQVFTDKDAGVVHNLTCMTMMLIAMPLVHYFKEDLDKINKLIVPIVTAVTMLNFTVCSILHFSGIADFHETLFLTHITIGLAAVCAVVANFIRCFRSFERSRSDIPAAIAMIFVGIAAITDMLCYKNGLATDNAFFTRIAAFVYIILLGISNLTYVVGMVKKGMKTDIVSRLAYEDGLTGLGNRTAYKEAIAEIKDREVTVFVFDINNLKYVNDNIGHAAGDKLIKAGAEMIEDVFGRVGRCYRTGGDEFVCLADGAVHGAIYAESFYDNIKEFNKRGELEFPLMVAMGYEIYTGAGTIRDAIDSADKKMYIKKSELKKNENGKYARNT